MLDTDKPVGTSQVPPPEQGAQAGGSSDFASDEAAGLNAESIVEINPIVSQMAITHDGAAIGRRMLGGQPPSVV